MQDHLRTIDWRLDRAEHHLTTLERERDTFLAQDTHGITGHFEPDSNEYVFTFAGQLPDTRIGLIVGEFAHNLRAALDNLVWSLVLHRRGEPNWKNQFPIFKEKATYDKQAPKQLAGTDSKDRDVIEGHQPFQHGDKASESYLWLLAWLNNRDKHRFLHVGCVLPFTLPIRVVHEPQGTDVGRFPWNPLPLAHIAEVLEVKYPPMHNTEDPADLARVVIRPSGPEPQMRLNTQASVELSFSHPGKGLIFDDLSCMYGLVRQVIDDCRSGL